MKTYTSDGHICTDIEIFFNGNCKTLQNVVIDTGAVQSILNSEFVGDIGIKAEYIDEFMKTHGIGGEMMFFCRKIEKLRLGNFEFTDIDVDFGEIDSSGGIQGLIGLDLLKLMRAVIDVEIPEIKLKGHVI